MIRVLEKLFCRHTWKIHAKKIYQWKEIESVKGTQNWYRPKMQEFRYTKTFEILICEKCGKVQKIDY